MPQLINSMNRQRLVAVFIYMTTTSMLLLLFQSQIPILLKFVNLKFEDDSSTSILRERQRVSGNRIIEESDMERIFEVPNGKDGSNSNSDANLDTSNSSMSENSYPKTTPGQKFATQPAAFGLTQDDIGGSTDDTVRIYHDATSLCDHSKSILQLPTMSYDDLDEQKIAILAARGECSFEEKARNVVSLYQSKNSLVQYLIVFDDEKDDDRASSSSSSSSSGGQNDEVLIQMSAESSADAVTGKNNDEIVKERIPIVMLFVAHATGNAIIDAATSNVNGPYAVVSVDAGSPEPPSSSSSSSSSNTLFGNSYSTLGPLDASCKNKVKILLIQILASVVLTMVSFAFTAGILLYFWRDSVSIELSRSGIVFSQLEQDFEPDEDDLLKEEHVMSLPIIEYGEEKQVVVLDNNNDDSDDDHDEDEEMQELLPNSSLNSTSAIIICGDCNSGSAPGLAPSTPIRRKPKKQICHNTMCSICLEDYELKEKLRVLPCGHLYHTECILPWLTTRAANCPMCKETFVVNQFLPEKSPDNTAMSCATAKIRGLTNRYRSSCAFIQSRLRRARHEAEDSDTDDDDTDSSSASNVPTSSDDDDGSEVDDLELDLRPSTSMDSTGTPRRRIVATDSSLSDL